MSFKNFYHRHKKIILAGIISISIFLFLKYPSFLLILLVGIGFLCWKKSLKQKKNKLKIKFGKKKALKSLKNPIIKNGYKSFLQLELSKKSFRKPGKLSEKDLSDIKRFRKEGWEIKKIQMETGISGGTISRYTKNIKIPYLCYQRRLLGGIFEGSIIDLETTNLEPHKSEVITLGYITKNLMKVIQRREITEYKFLEKISQEIQKLPRPIYAFNAQFETKFLKHKLDLEISLIDILLPLAERANQLGVKIPSLDELAPVPREYFGEKQMKGKDVTKAWEIF